MHATDIIRFNKVGDCSGSRQTIFGWGMRPWQFPCLKKLSKFWKRYPISLHQLIPMENLRWRIYVWVRVNKHWRTPAGLSIWHSIYPRLFIPWILDLQRSLRFILNCGNEHFMTPTDKWMPINISCLLKKRSNSCALSKGSFRLVSLQLIITRAGMNG